MFGVGIVVFGEVFKFRHGGPNTDLYFRGQGGDSAYAEDVAGTILIYFASVTLLVAAFGLRSYNGPLSSLLLTLVLIALCTAIILHARFLILARREHRETAKILDATEREFQSIFDNALDGILILDDRGTCLEANPAALQLLEAQRDELIGHPIQKFHPPQDDTVANSGES